MKAILIQNDERKSLVWSDVPDPVAKEDEVVIKVAYAALNRADLMQRAGNYPPPPGCPDWMGLEVSGEIVSMGAVSAQKSGFKVGDKVCALLGGGGYAEYVAVPYGMCMPIPKNTSMVEAAAIPEAFATAYLNMFIEGGIKQGNTLLVTAGASGLASVIIPMAKLFGIRVITTVRSDEKAKAIEPLGADLIVNTKKQKLSEVLKAEMEAGRPVDVAIDCVGGEEMGECLYYLAHGARWIMIAALGGTHADLDLRNVFVRNVRVIGSTLRSRTPAVKAEILGKLVKDVWAKVESGALRPTIFRVLPITEAEAAHALLENSESVGKVVLKVNG
ncbi:MAG: NAD(P)H-quinone oxidoreductase [Clostridia bacterium]|nr:NAD(P)H-quinone oxidoreductase [Clostridia bacterium]